MSSTHVPAVQAYGRPVRFFSRSFVRPDIPRIGWVTGAGQTHAEPGANLTFFHHPILDVANKRLPVLGTARNVAIYRGEFAAGAQRPAHYAVIDDSDMPIMPTQSPDAQPSGDADHADMGDLGMSEPTDRSDVDDEPDADAASSTTTEPPPTAEGPVAEALRVLRTSGLTRSAWGELCEYATPIQVLPDADIALCNDHDIVWGSISYSPAKPGRGYTLSLLAPNGRGFTPRMTGVESTRRTDPDGSVFRLLETAKKIAEAVHDIPKLASVAVAIASIMDSQSSSKRKKALPESQ